MSPQLVMNLSGGMTCHRGMDDRYRPNGVAPTARRTWADLRRRGAGEGGVDLRPADAAPTEETLQLGGCGSTYGGVLRGREGSTCGGVLRGRERLTCGGGVVRGRLCTTCGSVGRGRVGSTRGDVLRGREKKRAAA
jgi:hypothetical protein